jgi:hypothetical protein
MALLLLLLLLADLFHKILDFMTLLGAVALRVMHRAPLATLIAARRPTWVLIATWATTPTSRYSYSGRSTG